MRRALSLLLSLLLLLAGACEEEEKEREREPERAEAAGGGLRFSDREIAAAIRREVPEQWFGLYVGGTKAGYARVSAGPTGPEEPGAYAWTLELTLKTSAAALDREKEFRFRDRRFYAGEPPYRLVEIRTREVTDGGLLERRLAAEGEGFSVVERLDGEVRSKSRVGGSEETLAGFFGQFALDPARVRPGDAARFPSFDLERRQDEIDRVEVKAVEDRRIAGVSTRVALLETRTEGEDAVTRVRVAAGGKILRAEMGNLLLKLEDRETATSDVRGFDVIDDAVPAEGARIGDPSEVTELELLVEVPDDFELPGAPNQRVERRGDGRYRVRLEAAPGAAVTGAERRTYLAAGPTIDHESPAIARRAAELLEGAAGDREKVRRLGRWVHEAMEKDLSTNLSTASQVLEARVGDCTEHAILLVALARAAGLPAREVSGLVYLGDSLRRFGYHAWAEVAVDGRWLPVDPSWGEEVANATHLKLGVGVDSDWVMAMGAIEIRVLRRP